ncbi:putative leader peptide [Streptomyces sp. NPDC058871]|uniref:putative leader peptide n=1 Tax=unclassified Streptomyces TaxID=2593676 RepID=UPI003697658C
MTRGAAGGGSGSGPGVPEAPVHTPAHRVTRLTSARSRLTGSTGDRQAGGMRYELLLYGRFHVDLVRYASALCPDR